MVRRVTGYGLEDPLLDDILSHGMLLVSVALLPATSQSQFLLNDFKQGGQQFNLIGYFLLLPYRAIAESAVSDALDANAGNISNWLSGSSGRLRLDYTGQSPIGISVTRGASSAVDANSTRLILVRNPSVPAGYQILTGFPTKP